MIDPAREFFHATLGKIAPSLSHHGREDIINKMLHHTFNHPWVDEEVQQSMVANMAREHGLAVPDEFQELVE